jgi:putative DNA primase/helicase
MNKPPYDFDFMQELAAVVRLNMQGNVYNLYSEDLFQLCCIDPDISNNDVWIESNDKLKKIYYDYACRIIRSGFEEVKKYIENLTEKVVDENKQRVLDLVQNGLNVNNVYQNVQYLHKLHPFCYDKGKFYYFWDFEQCLWVEVDEVDIMNAIDKKLKLSGQTTKSHVIGEYLNVVKRIGRDLQPKELPPEMIQFKNSVFNIRTKKISNATPEYFHINSIPHSIGETDKTPYIDKLITEWVGEENLLTAKEIIAYCCYNEYSIHRVFVFIGGGSNGKSTFMQLIENFIGKKNICSTSLDALIENRFETFSLYGKKVASVGETNFGLLERTDLIKKLSGNDVVKFEAKNKGSFEGRNTAKLIVSSNSLPTSDDRSDGFYRRFLILDFPNQFKEKVDLLRNIPEEEYKNLANWCVNNLPKILDKGGFTNEGTIEQRKQKYILSSNPLPIFIERCCIVDQDNPSMFTPAAELYQIYVQALTKAKKRIVHRKEFIKTMTDAGFRYEKINKSLDNGAYFNGWAILGINIDKDLIKNLENIFRDRSDKNDKVSNSPLYIYSSCKQGINCHKCHEQPEEIYKFVYYYGKDGVPLSILTDKYCDEIITNLLSNGTLYELPAGIIKTNWRPNTVEEDIL